MVKNQILFTNYIFRQKSIFKGTNICVSKKSQKCESNFCFNFEEFLVKKSKLRFFLKNRKNSKFYSLKKTEINKKKK